MRALQFIGHDRVAVNESTVPSSPPTTSSSPAGASGSATRDLELLAGRYIIPFEYPVIPGHEWAGEVVAVGPGGQGLGRGRPRRRRVRHRAGPLRLQHQRRRGGVLRRQGGLAAPPAGQPVAGRRARSSSRSAAATTRPCAPTTSTRATPSWCSGPGRSAWAWSRRPWAGARGCSSPSRRAARGDLARQLGAEVVLDPTRGVVRRRGRRAHRRPTARPSYSRRVASRRRWPLRSRSLRFRARHRLHRHRRRGLRSRRARPVPVQGAAGARHHRFAGGLAADPAVPLPQRSRPQPTGDVDLPPGRGGRGDLDAVLADRPRSRSTSPRRPRSDREPRMRAGVLHGPRDLRVEDRPDPQPAAGRGRHRGALNGLCGTDATEYTKGPMMVPLADRAPGQRPRRADRPRTRVHRHCCRRGA